MFEVSSDKSRLAGPRANSLTRSSVVAYTAFSNKQALEKSLISKNIECLLWTFCVKSSFFRNLLKNPLN